MTVTARESFEFADLPGRRAADPLQDQGAASSARFVLLRRGPGRTAHRHPHSEEVIYVVAGSGYTWVDGVEHRVGPGDVVRIPAGVAHATVPDEGVGMELMCFFPHPDLASNAEDTGIVVTGE
jgi:quercetin dioxygenase-like cupin family protein